MDHDHHLDTGDVVLTFHYPSTTRRLSGAAERQEAGCWTRYVEGSHSLASHIRTATGYVA